MHSDRIGYTGPVLRGVSEKAKKLTEQLRDKSARIIFDRERKDR